MLRSIRTYREIFSSLMLYGFMSVLLQYPVLQVVQWVSYTSTVINAEITELSDSFGAQKHHVHSQETALSAMHNMKKLSDQQQKDSKEDKSSKHKNPLKLLPPQFIHSFIINSKSTDNFDHKLIPDDIFLKLLSPPPKG